MLDTTLQDLRLTLRQLGKSKGFTVTAVMTVALAIGANTAIFTLVNAVMLKSLPVTDPARLYRLGDGDNCCVIGGLQGRFSIYSYPLYEYLRDHTPEFEQMAAFQGGPAQVGVHRAGPGQVNEPLVDQFVSGTYFSLFGLRPYAGRLLAPADDTRGAPPVAVMSYRVWRQQYGADPGVVGSTFVIDGYPFTIAGIAPPGFFGDTMRPDPPDFWLPLAIEPAVHQKNALLDRKQDYWLYSFGRVRPGTAMGALEAKINAQMKQWMLENDPPLTAQQKQAFERQHIRLAPGGSGIQLMQSGYGSDLKLLMAVTGLVLLIACANLANLLLARGAATRAQASIRMALGAPRARLIRQTLTEAVTIAILGGAIGVFFAVVGTDALLRLTFGASRFVPIESAPSLPVLGFSLLLSLATGVVFGIAPAWSASRADPAAALRGAGRSAANPSTLAQRLLVSAQVALSLVLLAGAGLMLRTLGNLQNQNFGFRPEGRVIVNVHAAFSGYAPEKLAAIYREIERRMSGVAGVRSAAMSLYSPMEGNNWSRGITLEDRPDDPAHPLNSSWDRVSPRFFETIGARILRGRMFDERDTPDATHVAVVNQEFAAKMFPNQDPIGKRFGFGGREHRADYAIVGVVENVTFRNPRKSTPPPMFFLPLLQMWKSEWNNNSMARSNLIGNIELRVAGGDSGLAGETRAALAGVDPNLTVVNVTTIQDQLADLLGHERLIAQLTALFGVLALLLAAVGLYGVTAHTVAGRTGEIGVRMALGATRPSVIGMILRGVFAQVAWGVAIGVPAALAGGRILADQLFGVRSSDPATMAAVTLALAAAALLAGFLPALRASSIDPVRALRSE
ncbi:MAG TPA: ABC transporter permease [Candidatus Solibacter sp.]